MRWTKVNQTTRTSFQPRLKHGAINWCDRLLIFGGASSHSQQSGMYNDVFVFDKINEFRRMSTLGIGPSPKINFALIKTLQDSSLESNRILVIGGQTSSPCAPAQPWFTSTENFEMHVLDPRTGTWTKLQTTGSEPTLSNKIRCIMISSNELLAVGGVIPEFHPIFNYDHQRTQMEISVLRFTNETFERGKWHRLAEWTHSGRANPAPRMEPHLVNIGPDHVMMFGGRGAANIYLQDAWILKIIRHQNSNFSYGIQWHSVQIENPLAPPLPSHIFPSCVVGNLLVFAGVRTIMKKPSVDKPKEEPKAKKETVQPQPAVEKRPIVFINQERPLNTIGAMAAFATATQAPAPYKIRIHMMPPEPVPEPPSIKRTLNDYPMRVFALDLSDIMMQTGHGDALKSTGARLRWIQMKNGGLFPNAPDLRALGSLTLLDNGLALVGGIRRSQTDEDVLFTQSTNDVFMLHYCDD